MLRTKMRREMVQNFGQFLSIFILIAIAMMIYCLFQGNTMAYTDARSAFHKQCHLADIWVYAESFTQENLQDVRNLDFVSEAELRTKFRGTAPDCDGAQLDIYLTDEDIVNQTYLVSGEAYHPQDQEGIWLTHAFAEKRNIQLGDDFTMEFQGVTFTRKVKGLIESVEYEYRQADGDADVYLENIAFVYMGYDTFVYNEKNSGKHIPYTELVIRTKDGKGLAYEEAIAHALHEKYAAIIDRKSVFGLARLDSEVAQHRAFSYIFVIIFVGIAILVIATTMGRMIDRQRTQIGTLNALGMKSTKIIWHYMSFSLVVAALGALLGVVVGAWVLAPAIVDMFGKYYIVPGLEARFQLEYVCMAIVLVVVCVMAAFISSRKILKIRPAEALRPSSPKSGKRCLFERFPFWHRLGFTIQYNLRDISRAKLRAIMGIAGTMAGMILMVYGIACNDLVKQMVDLNFDKVQSVQYQVKFTGKTGLDTIDAYAKEQDGELVMTDQIEVSKVEHATSKDKKKYNICVLEGKQQYNILDLNQNIMTIHPGTVGVSRKTANDLNLAVGDTFYWHIYSENSWHRATVGYIYHSAEMQGIVYLRNDYEKIGAVYVPSVMYTDSDVSEHTQTFISSIHSKEEGIQAFEKSMETIHILVYAMILFSSVLIVVVLYNSGNLSFHERVKEFATLKVMGLSSSRIRNILTVQNIGLSIMGILFGAPLGKSSLNAMMNSNGENYDYNFSISLGIYIAAGFFVLMISMLTSYFFNKRIKNLDMVEVLKGVE